MLGTGTTRRSVLGATTAAGAALLTGCSERSAAHRTQGAAARDAGTVLRRRSARASGTLLALYDAVLAQHPDAATEKLAGPLRDTVALHVAALTRTPGAAPSPSAPASPEASPAPAPPGVPADRKAALKALAAAERRTADAHTRALAGAPPELARLLASVAAACAVHAYLLTRGDHR
ncbi:twin-arginine translocation signal domain-containing protein [Streptomyces sp. NBC_00859]|uniref:twin-arginine translocation signal domain-containing protein n=1 Tax=Streptomyces sp. NBC_00859 TaxID=2903682 RepID=UPI0038698288|nr:twin-arginine translocation signal domain-containing protein [Streptomyces sp. NBC_00859]